MGLIEDCAQNHLEYLEGRVGTIKLQQMKALSDSSVEGRAKYYEICSELLHVERKISELRKALEEPYSFDARNPLREALREERTRLLETLDGEVDSEKKNEIQNRYVEITNAINSLSA
ncbi:MAG: hypothetical protein ACI4BI_05080 [Anaerotardibacter sp.]